MVPAEGGQRREGEYVSGGMIEMEKEMLRKGREKSLMDQLASTSFRKSTNRTAWARPVVSACSCPTELTSSYLNSVFSPMVQSLFIYIRDSSDALRQFRNDAIRGLRFFLEQRPKPSLPKTTGRLLRRTPMLCCKNDLKLPVACHFNTPPCSLANISVSG
eukprot:g41790.t1